MNKWHATKRSGNGTSPSVNGGAGKGQGGWQSNPHNTRDESSRPLTQESDDDGDEEEDWIQKQIRGHHTQMREQDQHLDDLGSSVARLGEISLTISHEINQQNDMLENVADDFETAISGMDVVTRKTQELVRKSGGMKWFMLILCLVVVLIVLTLMVIYF